MLALLIDLMIQRMSGIGVARALLLLVMSAFHKQNVFRELPCTSVLAL
jgi:hypothetical protein